MKSIKMVLAVVLCCSIFAYTQGNTFNKVRYNGGSISTKVKSDDWDNKLTVSTDAIIFALKDGQTINIPPKQVTSISYGQEAHRRIGTAIGIGILSLGAGALFALHKTKLHYIGLNYADKDSKKQGLLLQGDKSNFRAIIVALQGVTGAPVSVGEKERSEIPAGVTVQTVKQPDEQQPAQVPAPAPTAITTSTEAQGSSESVSVVTNPDGAEIYIDNSFVGNTPATLKLKPGKHTITLKHPGYKDWSREFSAESGVEAHVTVPLEKAS